MELTNENKQILKATIKEVLKVALVDFPPKYVHGNKGWNTDVINSLVQTGIIKGTVRMCCEKKDWCDSDRPCGYVTIVEDENISKTLNELVDLL